MSEFLNNKLERWKKEGRLLMECVAGSHLYNLNTPSSDMDIRGVFAPSLKDIALCKLMSEDPDEVSDDCQDTKYYSLPKFIELASNCNPNIVELLFIPDSKMNFTSRAWSKLILHRDLFISKRALYTFSGYAYAQIKKSRGQGKKANSVDRYVNEDGIRKLRMFLMRSSLEKTGISDLESAALRIKNIFGSDFFKFLNKEKIELMEDEITSSSELMEDEITSSSELIYAIEHDSSISCMKPPSPKDFISWYKQDENGFPFRQIKFTQDISSYDASRVEGSSDLYRLYHNGKGFFSNNGCEPVLTSISCDRETNDFAGVVKINLEEYKREKMEYDSFWEWMANRNEERYVNCWDENKTCDMKNLMHCVRLLICAESIATSGRPKVEFNGEDREFLMKIRRGEEDADDILEMAEKKMRELEDIFKSSSIPESIDKRKICSILLKDVYPEIYGMNF